MINIWIIFFTQYSQKEIDDLLIRISTINQKIQSYTFFQIFCLSMNKWKDKNDLWAIVSS